MTTPKTTRQITIRLPIYIFDEVDLHAAVHKLKDQNGNYTFTEAFVSRYNSLKNQHQNIPIKEPDSALIECRRMGGKKTLENCLKLQKLSQNGCDGCRGKAAKEVLATA